MYDEKYVKYLKEYCQNDVDAVSALYERIRKDLEKKRILEIIKKICYVAIYTFFLVWFICYWVIRSRKKQAL